MRIETRLKQRVVAATIENALRGYFRSVESDGQSYIKWVDFPGLLHTCGVWFDIYEKYEHSVRSNLSIVEGRHCGHYEDVVRNILGAVMASLPTSPDDVYRTASRKRDFLDWLTNPERSIFKEK